MKKRIIILLLGLLLIAVCSCQGKQDNQINQDEQINQDDQINQEEEGS